MLHKFGYCVIFSGRVNGFSITSRNMSGQKYVWKGGKKFDLMWNLLKNQFLKLKKSPNIRGTGMAAIPKINL